MSTKAVKKNKKGGEPDKPKQKPGNKGDFHGLRYNFLIAQLAGYMEASRNGKTCSFWPSFFEKYWETFNWHLSLNKEPIEGATWPNDDVLSPDDLYKKSQTQLFLKVVSFFLMFTVFHVVSLKTNLLEDQNMVQSSS
jgi:hypothetical protein